MSLVFDDRNVTSFHLPISLFEIFRSLTSLILILEIIFNVQFSRYKHNLLRKLLREIASRFSVFPPECFAFLFWIETVLSRFRGDREIRTLDPLLARQVLSQLSYAPLVKVLLFSIVFSFRMGLNGLEPSTSRLSGVRSNQLSYKPIFFFNLAATRSPMPSPA